MTEYLQVHNMELYSGTNMTGVDVLFLLRHPITTFFQTPNLIRTARYPPLHHPLGNKRCLTRHKPHSGTHVRRRSRAPGRQKRTTKTQTKRQRKTCPTKTVRKPSDCVGTEVAVLDSTIFEECVLVHIAQHVEMEWIPGEARMHAEDVWHLDSKKCSFAKSALLVCCSSNDSPSLMSI